MRRLGSSSAQGSDITTLVEQRQAIVQRYRDAGQRWPATAREIAAWAIATKQWEPSHADLVERCADDLARAMREEFIIDDSGRRVRAKVRVVVRKRVREGNRRVYQCIEGRISGVPRAYSRISWMC